MPVWQHNRGATAAVCLCDALFEPAHRAKIAREADFAKHRGSGRQRAI
jgi:hypothetical protein